MKNLELYENFGSPISPMDMEMKGKSLVNKIDIGSKFIGRFPKKVSSDKSDEVLTVTGFGDRANAFRTFQVEKSDGSTAYLRVTIMYGTKYQVMDTPRGNWENSEALILKEIIIE